MDVTIVKRNYMKTTKWVQTCSPFWSKNNFCYVKIKMFKIFFWEPRIDLILLSIIYLFFLNHIFAKFE